MQPHLRTKQSNISHKMRSNSSVIVCAEASYLCSNTEVWSTSQKILASFGIFSQKSWEYQVYFFSFFFPWPVPQIFIWRKISATLQIKLITDYNKQSKYTQRFKTKVRLEFIGRQTNQKHVNVKSQGRQVSRDQWATGGSSGKEDVWKIIWSKSKNIIVHCASCAGNKTFSTVTLFFIFFNEVICKK